MMATKVEGGELDAADGKFLGATKNIEVNLSRL
jgi:hypothetical protein